MHWLLCECVVMSCLWRPLKHCLAVVVAAPCAERVLPLPMQVQGLAVGGEVRTSSFCGIGDDFAPNDCCSISSESSRNLIAGIRPGLFAGTAVMWFVPCNCLFWLCTQLSCTAVCAAACCPHLHSLGQPSCTCLRQRPPTARAPSHHWARQPLHPG
jgi:hypothetical protein